MEVVETILPKKKRAMTETQKEYLRLGRAIARKNKDEEANAKLDKMVDNYLKPYAGQETSK